MKKIFINFNLVFDYNSLLFCVLRSYVFPKGINIKNGVRPNYELKLPQQAYQSIHNDQINNKCSEAEFLDLLQKNFDSIKPIVGSIDTIQYLNGHGFETVIYTNIPQQYLKNISTIHSNWLGTSKIQYFEDLKNVYQEACLIAEGDMELVKHFSSINSEGKKTLVYIRNSDFHNKEKKFEVEGCLNFHGWEDIKWQQILKGQEIKEEIQFPQPEYFLQLKEEPKSKAFLGFNQSIKLVEKVVCESKVIHGQGKAAKELGIPTANLEVTKEIEAKINPLLTGVYAGSAELNGKHYQSLFFIGSSQYFEDQRKQLECYIYHEFQQDFYDSIIKIEITDFTRTDADFKSFDHLIKVIHCDHAQGRQIKN